jgi:hypothetical protein
LAQAALSTCLQDLRLQHLPESEPAWAIDFHKGASNLNGTDRGLQLEPREEHSVFSLEVWPRREFSQNFLILPHR